MEWRTHSPPSSYVHVRLRAHTHTRSHTTISHMRTRKNEFQRISIHAHKGRSNSEDLITHMHAKEFQMFSGISRHMRTASSAHSNNDLVYSFSDFSGILSFVNHSLCFSQSMLLKKSFQTFILSASLPDLLILLLHWHKNEQRPPQTNAKIFQCTFHIVCLSWCYSFVMASNCRFVFHPWTH